MQTIFMTGATGTMGWAGLKELLLQPERYHVRILTRHSQKNKLKLIEFQEEIDEGQLEIIWGDLNKYADILKGVSGADVVLHVGGMVSPSADYHPKKTRRVNVGAARNIRDAILAQEKQPRLVYIGSIAQMGDRREPLHWGRTGDPICVSPYDHYGLTKVLAERILTDSGIQKWVSLRQSGILHPGLLKSFGPIMYHVPLRGVLEWSTVEDSGRVLERVCHEDLPDDFWNHYYNISSGEQYRLSNYRFECLLLNALGCPGPKWIFKPQWFATRNFHGMWYLDSDILEDYLHFRANVPVKQYFKHLVQSDTLPGIIHFAATTRVAKLFPHCIRLAMGRIANKETHGTQWWIKNKTDKRIKAYYGSKEAYQRIPNWKHQNLSEPSQEAIRLDHGYDEEKPQGKFTLQDMQQVARFRGGKCLSEHMEQGDWDTQLEWEDAEGNRFMASPRLILLGGHWSPYELPNPYYTTYGNDPALNKTRPWRWDQIAHQNPFLAQVWSPLHDKGEDNEYGPEIFDGWED